MEVHQAPLSLGFSRQEHWSGLPFPSPMHESEKWKWSCSVVSDPQWPHRLQPSRLLHPWDFPGRSTGVGCHCLLFRTLSAPPNLVSATNTRCLFSTLSCGSLIKYLYKSFPINIFFWFPDCLGVLNWVHVLILSKNYTWLSELFADLWKKKSRFTSKSEEIQMFGHCSVPARQPELNLF